MCPLPPSSLSIRPTVLVKWWRSVDANVDVGSWAALSRTGYGMMCGLDGGRGSSHIKQLSDQMCMFVGRYWGPGSGDRRRWRHVSCRNSFPFPVFSSLRTLTYFSNSLHILYNTIFPSSDILQYIEAPVKPCKNVLQQIAYICVNQVTCKTGRFTICENAHWMVQLMWNLKVCNHV